MDIFIFIIAGLAMILSSFLWLKKKKPVQNKDAVASGIFLGIGNYICCMYLGYFAFMTLGLLLFIEIGVTLFYFIKRKRFSRANAGILIALGILIPVATWTALRQF